LSSAASSPAGAGTPADLAVRITADCDALLAALADGRAAAEDLPAELIPRLLTLGAKLFAARREAGDPPFPFTARQAVTPTEVSVTVAHALRAAEIDLFELVLWQGLA
jgi:hypothetical protein